MSVDHIWEQFEMLPREKREAQGVIVREFDAMGHLAREHEFTEKSDLEQFFRDINNAEYHNQYVDTWNDPGRRDPYDPGRPQPRGKFIPR